MVLSAAAPRGLAGPPQADAAPLVGLGHRFSLLWHHVLVTQPLPPRWLVAGCGLVALVVVASGRFWPATRIVVTIVHEGGHALAAVACGRRLAGVRLYRTTAGETVSAGPADGPGRAVTAAAGYPAPSVLGLGAAVLLSIGHLTALLLVSLVLLAGLATAVRNVYGMLAVVATGGLVAGVALYGPTVVQAAFGYAMTWFLLLGGLRPVLELWRERRRSRTWHTDADQLGRITAVPAGSWVLIFGVVAAAAVAVSARLLLG